MASELYVETLKGLTSGANANKVIIPAGQTLDASAGTVVPSSGQIVQVVHSTLFQNPDQVGTSSTSYSNTGHSATITPTSTSSKIYVQLITRCETPNNLNQALRIKFFRDSTEIYYSGNIGYTDTAAQEMMWGHSQAVVDSPATTSAIVYKTMIAARESGSNVNYNVADAVLTLWEIAG